MGLSCTSCGYDNDPTRVYCHNCGTKLDRGETDAPPPGSITPMAAPPQIKKRREPIAWGSYFSFFFKLLVLVALIAGLTLALLPPRIVPEPVTPDERLASKWSGLVHDASDAPGARGFAISAADLQRWLTTVVKFQHPEQPWKLDPRRVYLQQEDGAVRVGVQATVADVVDIYFEAEYQPVREGGVYTLKPRRYFIGRLSLPVALGWPVERQLSSLGDALAGSLAELASASSIEVKPSEVKLKWEGKSAR